VKAKNPLRKPGAMEAPQAAPLVGKDPIFRSVEMTSGTGIKNGKLRRVIIIPVPLLR